MGQRLVVSEFPNDNPELHDGLVWACPTPCAPALPTLRLRPSERARVLKPNWEPRSDPRASFEPLAPAELSNPEPAVEAEPIAEERVEAEPVAAEPVADADQAPSFAAAEQPFAEMPVEQAPEAASAEAPASGFDAFVRALSAILAERGATRAAASVGALLGRARLARDAFDAETRKVLAGRGFIDAKTGRPMPEFTMVAQAWRDVLEGTGADLSACGSATLDVWGAEVLAALLGLPRERSDELRRALRQRGVAAFGMLAAA